MIFILIFSNYTINKNGLPQINNYKQLSNNIN